MKDKNLSEPRYQNLATSLSNKRFMWKTSLILVFVAALLGCQKSPSQGAKQAQKITVAYTYQPESALFHVAVAKGYFAEEGLDVEPLMHNYGKTALQSVLDNQADFATVAETPIMFSVLKGEKIFVIANIEASSLNNAVVARMDAGIIAPRDLKGKRIAFTPGTTGDFFLDSLLTANGLTRDEIQAVPMKPEEMQDAIMAKKVDAASTWNYPRTLISRQLGPLGILFFDQEIYTETFNIAARQDFVQKNPETVKRFLRALIKSENFVAKNPDTAQAIMAKASKIDQSLIHAVWNDFNHHVVLNQMLLITLEDETRWAMKNRLTERTDMPNYRNFIHLDSLRSVNPEAVIMSQ